MYDYMRALYCRFGVSRESTDKLKQEVNQAHERLGARLDKEERVMLLALVDVMEELLDESCLDSFVDGYRLASGIQQELQACYQPYNFEIENERHALERIRSELEEG